MKNLFYFSVLINFILLITCLEPPENEYHIPASIYYIKTTGKYKVVEGVLDKMAAAYAIYTPSYETKGWDFLTVCSYLVSFTDQIELKIMLWVI